MGVAFDQVGLAARDPQRSARFLADVLGLSNVTPDGPDDDLFNVRLSDGSALLFAAATDVVGQHVAFRVSSEEATAVVARLQAKAVKFGNDPADPEDGLTSDPLGGSARIYFRDPDGHSFEVAA